MASVASATNVAIGTVTFKENDFGSIFKENDTTTVTLKLTGSSTGATFTPGVSPTINAPANYVITKPVTTGNSDTYSFTVKNNLVAGAPATITVEGLKVDTPNNGKVDVRATTSNTNGITTFRDLAVNVSVNSARLGGQDRYKTSSEVFRTFGNEDEVVLSGGLDFPDALSANYLAGQYNTGTLLTHPARLPEATKHAILDAGVQTVYITGGTSAVSNAVEDEIESLRVSDVSIAPHIKVVRLAGNDRYSTNEAVNNYNPEIANTVILASGVGFADAVAMGPVAYKNEYPVLLTGGESVSTSVKSQLDDFNPTNVVIAGGNVSVSAAVEAEIKALGYTVSRIAGADRVETAGLIAQWASEGLNDKEGVDLPGILGDDQGFNSPVAVVTNGDYFADALTGGPYAGNRNSVILLSANKDTPGKGMIDYLSAKKFGYNPNGKQVGQLVALGLSGVTSTKLINTATAAIGTK